jgi:outer membrane protein assembly factor BamB
MMVFITVQAAIVGAQPPVWSSGPIPAFHPPAKVPETGIGYRGDGTGVFPDCAPPRAWDEATGKNIRWRVPMPNFGSGCPVPVGNRVLAMSECRWHSLFPILNCYDADTGNLLWSREVDAIDALTGLSPEQRKSLRDDLAFCQQRWNCKYRIQNDLILRGGIAKVKNSPELMQKLIADFNQAGYDVTNQDQLLFPQNNSFRILKEKPDVQARYRAAAKRLAASGIQAMTATCGCGCSSFLGTAAPTPVSDGKHVYAMTVHGTVACYDMDGNLKWGRGDLKLKPEAVKWLYCSPRLYGSVLLTCFNGMQGRTDSRLIAWDKTTGKKLWDVPSDLPNGGKGNYELVGGNMAILRLASAKDAAAPKTAVVVTSLGTVVRLPDGMVYKTKLEPPSLYSGWGMDSERGFLCACTCAGTWYGSVLAVDGDELIVTERFRHKMTTEGAPTCANGRIYCSQYQFDGTTGELIGKGNSSDNALPRSPLNTGHNSPASQNLLLVAAGHVYGLTARIGAGQMWSWGPTDGTGEVFTLDGARVSRNLMRPEPMEGEKLVQYTTQVPWQAQWKDKFFSITCPMNISGSRLYIRSNDYLYCIEEGQNSPPTKTEGK